MRGNCRNELIARAKIILNIHFYLSGILETLGFMALRIRNLLFPKNSNPEDEVSSGQECIYSYEKIIEERNEYIELPEERKD